MNKRKIFNDPIYGFITIEHEIIFDLIEHPVFQRLRHIRQLGLTHLIYPGATHTRFHHALGAMHLVSLAIRVLRAKGVQITAEEDEGTCIAILLHDIGHSPFSHALEGRLIDCDHEVLSLHLMHQLNSEFAGRLDLAIEIFEGKHRKKFLHELVSSQLDMDRMDYLTRDSFYSGVTEGQVGYDRIITMLQVVDDRLVIEEKGIYSIEAFLIARKIMYWQVYLHKTVWAAELMMIKAIERTRELYLEDQHALPIPEALCTLFDSSWNDPAQRHKMSHAFLALDDYDIMVLLKKSLLCGDFPLDLLTHGLTQRKLFRVDLANYPFESDYIDLIRLKVCEHTGRSIEESAQMVMEGSETVRIYDNVKNEIEILLKNGEVISLSDFSEDLELEGEMTRYYLCYPKF